ncbi:MAG: HD domain-containing protein [Sarcina sp.]
MINDIIYGDFEIEEILEKLIETKQVQRLKWIYQGGPSRFVNEKWNTTRYEHSIGVMFLVKKLGGSLEEQIAALLHDISHTAFSHVIDFVLDYENEDYHEKIYERIIENSDIPKILSEYGLDYKDILFNEKQWTILEQSTPKICADRVDYTLRDLINHEVISIEEAKKFVSSIKIINGEMVIDSIENAQWFVETYYKEVVDYFMDPLNVYAYDALSKALKLAMKRNIITLEDMLGVDDYILEKIFYSKDNEIISLIESISPNIKVVEDKENYDIVQKKKLRIIDPIVLYNETLCNASKISDEIVRLNKEAYDRTAKGAFIKIIK